jgi:hypothetical protein
MGRAKRLPIRNRKDSDGMDYLTKYLDTYSLEEILEWNDVSEEEVLAAILKLGLVTLPEPRPVDT